MDSSLQEGRHAAGRAVEKTDPAFACPDQAPNGIIIWLWACCLLVFALVVLGGAVRLTGSGLSMVDWQPLGGVIPPLDEAQWRQAFDRYRQFPEFQLVNPDMTVAGFRFIFGMEYAHRLLGRVVGLVFLLPFLFFLARKMIPRSVVGPLWGLFFLGGAQGLLGWYMVKSGLADDPAVSPHRLLAHFMLAVVIYAGLLRVAVGLGLPPRRDAPPSTGITGWIALAMILLMMASGALVAGTRAGYIYNTWPTMGGLWMPEQLLGMQPWWRNFVENPVTIQFVHRWLAAAVLTAVGVYAIRLLRAAGPAWAGGLAWGGAALLVLVSAQITLGIATLILRVPTALGVAHQAGALLLLTATVIALTAERSSRRI